MNTRHLIFPWLKTLGAAAILIVMLYPVFWLISGSFQPGASTATIRAIPSSFDLGSYQKAIDEQLGPILTSLTVAIGTALLSVVVAAPAAFGLSRLRSRFVDVVLITLFIAQIVPGIVLSNSLYTMFQSIGLLNTIPGLILANASGSLPFALLLLRSFMLEIDPEILEAARLDGAGAVRTFLQIVAPISRNALITGAVFGFLAGWGDFLFALTLSTGSQLKTMTVGVYEYIASPNVDWSTVMAASAFASLPAIILLLVSQRYLRVGLGAGSGK